jgi:hypothetical protein
MHIGNLGKAFLPARRMSPSSTGGKKTWRKKRKTENERCPNNEQVEVGGKVSPL